MSEVADLKRQIELECVFIHAALYAPALTARHDIIAKKYDRLRAYQERLKVLAGEEIAFQTVTHAYHQVMEGGANP